MATTQDNAPSIVQLNPITTLSSTLVAATSPTVWPSVAIPAGNTLTQVWLPAETFAAGNLTFNVSFDNTNFYPLKNPDGTAYTLTVGALTLGSAYYIDPTVFAGTKYVQAVSTVSQANSTVINFTVKPV